MVNLRFGLEGGRSWKDKVGGSREKEEKILDREGEGWSHDFS